MLGYNLLLDGFYRLKKLLLKASTKVHIAENTYYKGSYGILMGTFFFVELS
jgi:hypothetical protein